MKPMLTLLLVLLCTPGWTQNADDQTKTLTSQCVATFIHQGLREDVVLWKGMFQLDNDEIMFFFQLLQQMEAEDDLPEDLLEAAIDSCREIFRSVQSSHEAPSQASGVDGSE